MKLIHPKKVLGAGVVAVALAAGVVFGAQIYRAYVGVPVEIDEFGTCKIVTNNAGADLFVPTKTSAEWNAFLANRPGSVSLQECINCEPGAYQACWGDDVYTFDSCDNPDSFVQSCPSGGYVCYGSGLYQYDGCSGGSCSESFSQSCTSYCSGDLLYGGASCDASAGRCDYSINGVDCDDVLGYTYPYCSGGTTLVTGSYCSGGSCYQQSSTCSTSGSCQTYTVFAKGTGCSGGPGSASCGTMTYDCGSDGAICGGGGCYAYVWGGSDYASYVGEYLDSGPASECPSGYSSSCSPYFYGINGASIDWSTCAGSGTAAYSNSYINARRYCSLSL